VKRPPVPRPRIYDLYWYYASERHRMFERRLKGEPGPWTSDPILREFKFCNVFRAADRVSQYMIRDVCYHSEPCANEDRLFQITAFRTFSKTATWTTVRDILGRYPTLDDLADGAFGRALDQARERNGGLYTGAFILCATDAYGQSSKHRNHVELFRHMFLHDQLGARLLEAKSLREVYTLLHGYPLMGDFMSYQTAIDLNYSALIGFSENDFTQPGPGALRGMKKCFDDPGDYTPAEIVLWMTERQDEELTRLGLPFGGLWGACTLLTARLTRVIPATESHERPLPGDQHRTRVGAVLDARGHTPRRRAPLRHRPRRETDRLAGPPRRVIGPRHRHRPGPPVVRQEGPRRLWDIADEIRHAWLTDGTLPAYGAAVTITPDGAIRLVKGRWQAEIPATSTPGWN
jgi:hypothetical protein